MMHVSQVGSRPVVAKLWQEAPSREATAPLQWQVAEEVAVGVLLNSRPVSVVMATPADLKDLGLGFLVSERYLTSMDAVRSLVAMRTEKGFCVDVGADPAAVSAQPQRTMEVRSSCGLCGMNALTDVALGIAYRHRRAPAAAAIAQAFAQLQQQQPMKSVNHSVHGAGFADFEGNLLLVREDVGRHNALDKLIGALLRQGTPCEEGFVVMTSRCSFELVQKAARAGFGALATLSAPTQLALDSARAGGLLLASAAPEGIALFSP